MNKFYYALFFVLPFIIHTKGYSQTILSSQSETCFGSTVTFTVTGTNDLCFYWDFSDGSYSTGTSKVVSHTYTTTATGLLAVNVNSYSDAGCSNWSGGNTIYVSVYDTAVGSIDNFPSQVCPNTTVDFYTPSDAAAYKWDFGDGSFSTQKGEKHRYATTGTKNIKLVFYKPCGNDTAYTSIVVSDTVSPVIMAGDLRVEDADTLICPGSKVRFDFGEGSNPDCTYRWYFGDGDSATFKEPKHVYQNTGVYVPMFVITNQCGKKDTGYTHAINVSNTLTPSISANDYGLNNLNDTLICPNTDVSFFYQSNFSAYYNYSHVWYAGDGAASTDENPVHQYSAPGFYTPTLSISNTCGNTINYPINKINVSATYNGPLLQSLQYYSSVYDSTCPNTPVNFWAWNPSGLSHTWYFGDGRSSPSNDVIHSYTNTAVYTPTLITTNGCGINTAYYPSSVKVVPTMHTDMIIFFSPDSICPGDSLSFSSYANGPAPLSYLWKFGEGGSSSMESPAYTYSTVASYNVELITTNGCNITDTATSVVIASGNTKPVIHFNFSSSQICVGDTIFFTPNNPNHPSYTWNFGDGTISNTVNPYHVFNLPGEYNDIMYLKVTNACGITDSLTFGEVYDRQPSFDVYDILIPDAGNDRSILTGGSTVIGGNPIYTGLGQSIDGYWTPSYGLNDTLIPNPIATPSVTTTYYIHIINGGLCESVDSVTVHVQNTLAGTIFRNNYVDTVKAGNVYLIKWDTTHGVQMPTVDTTIINADGTYSFGYVNQGKYYLLVAASTAMYPDAKPTYYGDTVRWDGAQIYDHVVNTNAVNISVKEYGGTVGIGRIAGIVVEGQNYGKMMGPGDPVKGIDVGLVKKPSPGIVQMTVSDTSSIPANSGKFEFKNLPPGNYELFANVTGVPLDVSFPGTTFTITTTDSTHLNVGIFVDSNLISLTTNIHSGIPAPDGDKHGISVSRVFPNPSPGPLNIEVDNYTQNNSASDRIRFQFFDIRGKEIESLQPFELQKGHSLIRINTVNLTNGIYMLGIQQMDNEQESFVKIISKVVIVK